MESFDTAKVGLAMRAGIPALTAEEVHVWQMSVELAGVLSREEHERASKFHFERDRRCFIVSRGSLRTLLAAYSKTKPAALQFAYSKHGKPSLVDCGLDLRFSLAHSGELAAVAVTVGRELGIDVELIREDIETDKLAERFFSEHERLGIRDLPEQKRVDAFFRCWTSKEAFLKAQGVGLSRGLTSFDVEVNPDLPARLLATRPEPREAQGWNLAEIQTRSGYAAALASEGKTGEIRLFGLGS